MGRPRLYDLRDRTFGRLRVIEPAPSSRWRCKCDCGAEYLARGSDLTGGRVQSCGCLRIDLVTGRSLRHGAGRRGKRSPEYAIWAEIIDRCERKTATSYPHYGGRGIRVHPEWRSDFLAFLRDVGPRPSKLHSLDRYPDNDGNYEPGNVRWATAKEQARNKRNNLIIAFQGRRMTLAEAVEITGVRYSVAYRRIHDGWPIEDALKPGRGPRSRHLGPPTATVAALGRACQKAGITLEDIKALAEKKSRSAP